MGKERALTSDNVEKWRKEFDIQSLLKEEFPSQFEALGFKFGKNKRGIPVTYNFYETLSQEPMLSNLDKFKRWRVQLMELVVRDLDFEHGPNTIIQIMKIKAPSVPWPERKVERDLSKPIKSGPLCWSLLFTDREDCHTPCRGSKIGSDDSPMSLSLLILK